MKKVIVAIGGGEIGKEETLSIDQTIVHLAKKTQPKVLFIPTASSDAESYCRSVEKIYANKLHCTFETLLLIKEKPDLSTIRNQILTADIIYVGGGNTLMMMKLWRRLGVDKLLKQAYEKGTILCGLSAGAICWFEHGHSDSMSFYKDKDWDYIRVKGLGFIRGLACPHFDGETKGIKRKKSFSDMVKKRGGEGIGIDNHAALLFEDKKVRILKSRESAGVHRVSKKAKTVIVAPLL